MQPPYNDRCQAKLIGRTVQMYEHDWSSCTVRHLASPVFVIKTLNLALWHFSSSHNCSTHFFTHLIKKMSSPRNAFSYQPLSESSHGGFETRLISLRPGGFNDCIYCTVYHANILERRPRTEYTALSYVWGDAPQTQSIQLGYHQLPTNATARTWAPGADCYKSFPVTTNLERALRHLRDRASERILWVDAICINQSDREECLSQVQGMSSVYKEAVEVRIWLGSVSDVCASTPSMHEELENYQLRRVPIPRGS
jgi:hypothetical protein